MDADAFGAEDLGPDGGEGLFGGRGGRGGRGEAKPRTAEELDAQMDEYFLKSGDEKLVAAKLNEDLDSYWKNKPAEMEE